MPDDKGLFSILLLGGAAYLAARYFGLLKQEPPEPPPAVAPDVIGLKKAMLNVAKTNDFYINQNGLMNWHQWAYIYRQVKGVDAPAVSANPDERMTLDEWFNRTFPIGMGKVSAVDWHELPKYQDRFGYMPIDSFVDPFVRSGGVSWFERSPKRILS